MSKTKKTKATGLAAAALHSVTGSFTPTDFRFFQGSAAEVDKLVATADSTLPFRNLDSVELRKFAGYVGPDASYLSPTDEQKEEKVAPKYATQPGQRDVAMLDGDKDTLVVCGSLKFVANYFAPQLSDSEDYRKAHADFVRQYLADGQLRVLMARYLGNVLDGKLLWRNQYGFNRRTVLRLRTDTETQFVTLTKAEGPAYEAMLDVMVREASTPQGMFMLEVAMIVELGFDAEVHPSQPFLQADQKKKDRPAESYSRVLSARPDKHGKDQVILTANKVGNALRRVDLGYEDGAQEAIAIELYGTVPTRREAMRMAKNSYFDLIVKGYDALSVENRHYVMGVFIKGGLLGFGSSKEE